LEKDMHKNRIFLALLLAVLVMFSVGASPQKPQPQGVLAPLKVGQPVALQDQGGSYEIRLTDVDVPMGHIVVDVGQDYVVLKDVAEVSETRIPIFAIKAVVLVKTKLK
jgi:hypothetical protein